MNEIDLYREKLKNEIIKPDNLLIIIETAVSFISCWNPMVGIVLLTALSAMKIGINHNSEEKLTRRINLIVETVDKIIERQKCENTNYEAAIICPELFRETLVFTDEERAKEHLRLIEALFQSGNFDFDDISEALRLVRKLSKNEYKLIKLIPETPTKWADFILIKEIEELKNRDELRLKAALLSLMSLNLIVKTTMTTSGAGPTFGEIYFWDSSETIKLSDYGRLLKITLEKIV